MDHKDAKALNIALEAAMHSFNVATHLAADVDDPKLKRIVASLAAEVISKIDYEILPYIYEQFPDLKPEADK
jgi:hypothetical protein